MMNRSTVTGIVIGVVIASAGAVVATNYSFKEDGDGLFGGLNSGPTYAEVLSVTPIVETRSTPREVCENVTVAERAPVKDERQIVGTVAGAVIGGVLGNQMGGGSGKKVATVAGAAAGGYAGNKVQENMQNKNTVSRTETRCETVYDSADVVNGYQVAYRLDEEEGTVRMEKDPGERIPVENGELKIDQ